MTICQVQFVNMTKKYDTRLVLPKRKPFKAVMKTFLLFEQSESKSGAAKSVGIITWLPGRGLGFLLRQTVMGKILSLKPLKEEGP